jgi:O-glycosyl hydrolase
VAAEQGRYDLDYAKAILASPLLRRKVGVLGIHAYSDFSAAELVALAAASEGKPKVWMTEFGDLDLSGEREWYAAWASTRRLFQLLEDGLGGALFWDAFDNYHDHDEAWTIYGLIRNARRIFTPKKRYYALKQVYRFVRPGWFRVGASTDSAMLRILAFAEPGGGAVSVVVMNEGHEDLALDIDVTGPGSERLARSKASLYRSSPEERCALVGRSGVRNENYPYTGIQVEVPAGSIATATTLG